MTQKTILRRPIGTIAALGFVVACSRGPAAARGPEASRGAEDTRAPAAKAVESGGAARAVAPAAHAAPREGQPAPDPTTTTAASISQQAVLATQEYNGDPDLRCDVLEVKRVSGGAVLIKWRLTRPPAAPSGGLVAEGAGAKPTISHGWSFEGAYFIDPAENKKYFGLKDSGGAWIGEGYNYYYKPGDRQVMWMKFPAPPETSTRITFAFPGFPPFEDLPVAP